MWRVRLQTSANEQCVTTLSERYCFHFCDTSYGHIINEVGHNASAWLAAVGLYVCPCNNVRARPTTQFLFKIKAFKGF